VTFDATSPLYVRGVLDDIAYDERYEFLVRTQELPLSADPYEPPPVGIELAVRRPDAITGKDGTGYGGVRWLSPHASRSDVVRTAFGAILAYNEHEAREFFRYRDRAIFNPHGDIDALWEAAAHTDYNERPSA
jgi:hypothetical protein